MTSSAYRAALYSCSPIEIPEMSGLFRMCAARGSTHSANSSGDSGHPCLVPLFMWNCSEGKPWCLTLAVGLPYRAMMARMRRPPKPNAPSVSDK
ncbi:hypothetical protein FKM82_026842 [Ascaphus truei]